MWSGYVTLCAGKFHKKRVVSRHAARDLQARRNPASAENKGRPGCRIMFRNCVLITLKPLFLNLFYKNHNCTYSLNKFPGHQHCVCVRLLFPCTSVPLRKFWFSTNSIFLFISRNQPFTYLAYVSST